MIRLCIVLLLFHFIEYNIHSITYVQKDKLVVHFFSKLIVREVHFYFMFVLWDETDLV